MPRRYSVKVSCQADVVETWLFDWDHDEEPTTEEVEEMLLLGDDSLSHVRDEVSGEHDRKVESIGRVKVWR